MDTSSSPILIYFICFIIQNTDCLTCYMCARANGSTTEEANLNCLVNSTELLCHSNHDRCYSNIHDESGNYIQKGCTSSELCIENTICCTSDYCNAGYATGMRTGYGKPCQIQSDCIQDTADMICSQTSDEPTLTCRCTEKRYNRGAICVLKSYVKEPCDNDKQCLLYNSYCENLNCRCGDQFYPNSTEETCLLKHPLTDSCSQDEECRADHSVCIGGMCVCKFGYYSGENDDHCSGAVLMKWSGLIMLAVYNIGLRILS